MRHILVFALASSVLATPALSNDFLLRESNTSTDVIVKRLVALSRCDLSDAFKDTITVAVTADMLQFHQNRWATVPSKELQDTLFAIADSFWKHTGHKQRVAFCATWELRDDS